jgi:hypothetical protein
MLHNKGIRNNPTPDTVSRLRRAPKDFESALEEVVGSEYWGKVGVDAIVEKGQIVGYEIHTVESRR